MINFISTGGPGMYILVLIAIALVVLIVKKGIELFGGRELTKIQMDRGLHAILFWGAFSAVLGVYSQLAGIYTALNVIMRAAEISPSVTAQGLAISFHTTLFGLIIFMLAGVTWFILQSRYRSLIRATV